MNIEDLKLEVSKKYGCSATDLLGYHYGDSIELSLEVPGNEKVFCFYPDRKFRYQEVNYASRPILRADDLYSSFDDFLKEK